VCGTKEEVREGRRSRRYGWFAQTGLLESHIRGLAASTPPWRSRTRTVPMRWRPLRFLASRHSALGQMATHGRCVWLAAWPCAICLTGGGAPRDLSPFLSGDLRSFKVQSLKLSPAELVAVLMGHGMASGGDPGPSSVSRLEWATLAGTVWTLSAHHDLQR
jgi:hypothetical protein